MSSGTQPWITAALTLFLVAGRAHSAADGEDPYGEPSPRYLRQFAEKGAKIFVLERFDAAGNLAARTMEKLNHDVEIVGPTERGIGNWRITLRGLSPCPADRVIYNRVQVWRCVDAARDYAGAIYNGRASVILCKTLVLDEGQVQALPASCFLLVGGDGEAFRTVNDDDGMVFLGLAAIGQTAAGRSRRPDLAESLSLARSMGFQKAD